MSLPTATPITSVPGPAVSQAHCIHCAYDLRGIASLGVCPECGKPIWHSTRVVGGSLAAWEAQRAAEAARYGAHSVRTWLLATLGVIATGFATSFGSPLIPGVSAAVVASILSVLHVYFTRQFLSHLPGDAARRLTWMPAAGVAGILITLGLAAVTQITRTRPWPTELNGEIQTTLRVLFVCLGCAHVSIVMSLLRPYAHPVLPPPKAIEMVSTAARARSTFLAMAIYLVVRWTPLWSNSWVRLGALILWCMVLAFGLSVIGRLKRLSKALDDAWKAQPAAEPAQPASPTLARMSTTPSTSGKAET